MDALIGLIGIALVVLGVPITLLILIFKSVKKNAIKKDKLRPLIFLVTGIVLVIIGLLMPSSEKEINNEEKLITEPETTIAEDVAEEKTEEENAEQPTCFEYADMTVNFIEYKIEENSVGEKCLVLYFDFTNNREESQAFGYTFTVKAFQNGVEMEPTYFHVNDETKNSEKEIKTGITLKVAEQYGIEDVSGNIEIEIEPFNIWSDKVLFDYEFSLDE